MSNQNDINNQNQVSAQEKRKAQLAARFASYQGGTAKAKRTIAEEFEQAIKGSPFSSFEVWETNNI